VIAALNSAASLAAPTQENTNELKTTLISAFNHAVGLAANSTDINTLKPILDTMQKSAYLNDSWAAMNSAWSQRQQQLQDSTGTEEANLIKTLNATTTPLATIYTSLDKVLAATYQPTNLPNLKTAVFNGINNAIKLITTTNYSTAQSKIAGYITKAGSKYTIDTATLTKNLSARISTITKSIRTSAINAFTSKVSSFSSAAKTALATKATSTSLLAQRRSRLTTAIQSAATVIDAHTLLKPTATELAQTTLKNAYVTFNDTVIKLLSDSGLIKKTLRSGKNYYTLAYNATAKEPKTSLKKVLTAMKSGFPLLSTTQKNMIAAINANI
jgi:hypothetical protein